MDFKLTSDNFKVIEDLDFDLNGTRYLYFKLKKKDIDTISALRLLSKKLKVPMDRFGYAGLKGKNAVTEQSVSVHGVSKFRLENLKLDNIQIEVLGSSDKRIFLHSHCSRRTFGNWILDFRCSSRSAVGNGGCCGLSNTNHWNCFHFCSGNYFSVFFWDWEILW